MSAKLILYWNIRHGCHSDFGTYFTQDFIPRVNDTGLMQIVAAWHTASGEGPFFVAEGVSDSLEDIESVIMGPMFEELRKTLLHLVSDYQTKLLVPRNWPASGSIEIEQGFKFNQHFNINAADIYAYDSFFKKTYTRKMAQWGIHLVGEWNVAVGATPYVVIETRAGDLAVIGEMLENPDYQILTRKLLNMVSGYGCKILVPSGHINT
ncbi:MAG: hypothetical protein QNI92_12060 [Desulfobacterales bacterium]|nr:hypothetical protein [Desulfobacterales bacterium]MDJ0912010.1 hypothetical protein [Desulfobacterales bacterium]